MPLLGKGGKYGDSCIRTVRDVCINHFSTEHILFVQVHTYSSETQTVEQQMNLLTAARKNSVDTVSLCVCTD